MGTGLYKTIKGKKVEITNKEVKNYIKKINKWDEEQYRKNKDIFRKKLKNYETYQELGGKKIQKQSATELLYKQARAKARYGKDYKGSLEFQRIESFTSANTGKEYQKSLLSHRRYKEARIKSYERITESAFGGLIRANEKAREIYNNIDDPIKREQALIEFANELHLKAKTTGQVIPTGETYGSDTAINFDYSKFL